MGRLIVMMSRSAAAALQGVDTTLRRKSGYRPPVIMIRLVAVVGMLFSVCTALAQKPVPPLLQVADVIVLRTGERLKGILKSCDPNSCVLGATTYNRDRLAWVGIAAESA